MYEVGMLLHVWNGYVIVTRKKIFTLNCYLMFCATGTLWGGWRRFGWLQRQEYKQAIILDAEGGKVFWQGTAKAWSLGMQHYWSDQRDTRGQAWACQRPGWERTGGGQSSLRSLTGQRRKHLRLHFTGRGLKPRNRSCFYPCWSLDPDCPTFGDWKAMELGRWREGKVRVGQQLAVDKVLRLGPVCSPGGSWEVCLCSGCCWRGVA